MVEGVSTMIQNIDKTYTCINTMKQFAYLWKKIDFNLITSSFHFNSKTIFSYRYAFMKTMKQFCPSAK